MEELYGCVICGESDTLRPSSISLRDHSLTGESFTLSRCVSCEALLTNPRPGESEIGKYYDFPEYVSHRDDAPGFINTLYQQARKWTTSRKVALLNRVIGRAAKRPYKLLDYGCGTGFFLRAARDAGWQVAGVEVNAQARAVASQRTGQTIAPGLPELPPETYDVISLWHVLEHIHQLDATVADLLSRLAPEGTLLVAVPNPLALDARHYSGWWAAFDVPRHLYHFTPQSIARLMERHGARVMEQIGQPLDSFYISLLSEKYKTGSALTGWLNGLRSLVSARQSGNYSSMLYVIRRAE